jgi:hypothetical protein
MKPVTARKRGKDVDGPDDYWQGHPGDDLDRAGAQL